MSRDSKCRIYERLAERAGVNLTPAECWLLFCLDEYAPVTPQGLAARLDLPEADLLRLHLQTLRERGLHDANLHRSQ